jgi:uncharacterized RDD family membrane protein YckC
MGSAGRLSGPVSVRREGFGERLGARAVHYAVVFLRVCVLALVVGLVRSIFDRSDSAVDMLAFFESLAARSDVRKRAHDRSAGTLVVHVVR